MDRRGIVSAAQRLTGNPAPHIAFGRTHSKIVENVG
jgi:hypothetical protein